MSVITDDYVFEAYKECYYLLNDLWLVIDNDYVPDDLHHQFYELHTKHKELMKRRKDEKTINI